MSRQSELAELSRIYDTSSLSNRNLIINGAMTVAQRSTSAVAAGNPNYPSVDRYVAWEGTDGAYTVEQSTDAPTGFSKSLKAQVTTADTSLAAGQYAQLVQRIEAQNLQHLDYGLSTAKTLTLSFWVKSNKTGTYCITAYKEDSTGSASTMLFPKEFSINSANTWENKTITIEPDSQIKSATGVIDDDNGTGMQIFWNLAQGSTYTGGTDGTWTTNTNHFATTNQVNWMDSTSNNFYLTGVQLEVGDTATPFEHRSYGDELARCQRYYQVLDSQFSNGSYLRYCNAYMYGATAAEGSHHLPVEMRATPTLTASGTIAVYDGANVLNATNVLITTDGSSKQLVAINPTGIASGGVQYRPCIILSSGNTTSKKEFSAEL